MKSSLPVNKFNGRIALVVCVVVAIAAVGLFTTSKNHQNQNPETIKTIQTAVANKDQTDTAALADKGGADKDSSSVLTPASSLDSDSSSLPMAPYGTLVSNHRPGQNNSGTLEQSQCITTPGASCAIKFTQGNKTKTLPSHIVNSSGSTIWEWDVKSAELTSGDWQVTAVATLESKTQSTTDKLNLEIL